MIEVVEVQNTPNPDARKFITNTRLTDRAKAFDTPASAQGDPLATTLFDCGPVSSVFILDRFVTITKFASTEWDNLTPRIRAAIEAHAVEVPATTNARPPAPSADLMAQIETAMDKHVRPALAGDGGGLEILGLNGFVLSLRYQGACGSCPSASTGTLYGIQNVLQQTVDPRLVVVSV